MGHLVEVEGDGVAEEGVDDVWVVVKFLVYHEGKDAHLGGTAVVKLDGCLCLHLLLIPTGLLHLLNACGLNLRLSVVGESKIDGTDEDDKLCEALLGNGMLSE